MSDDTVYVWDAADGECLASLQGDGREIGTCAWPGDGAVIFAATENGTVRVWDGASYRELATMGGGRGPHYYYGAFSLVYRAEYRDVSKRLFIQVARSKGLSETSVAFKHALPNAVLPVITFVGLSMGQLTGGAVVTESVFSIPGIGRLFVTSIGAHDFPVMLAIGMLIIIGVIVMNLIADVIYTLVNPQIRFD